jgi:NADPH:quinone reductase-like Zn-dependent oxidoreductase
MYVTVGGSMKQLLAALFFKPWISIFSKKHMCLVALKLNKDLIYMNELFEAGKVKPVIDGPYTLEETVKAFKHYVSGAHKGKIVIRILNI